MQEPCIGHIYKGIGGVQYEVLGHGYDPDSYILLRQDDGFGFTAYGARTVWGRIRWDYIHDGAYKDSPHRFTGGRYFVHQHGQKRVTAWLNSHNPTHWRKEKALPGRPPGQGQKKYKSISRIPKTGGVVK